MVKRLVAVGLACLVAVGAMGAAVAASGSALDAAAGARVAYPTSGEVSSFAFMADSYEERRAAGTEPLPVFGSSELNPAPAGPSHPAALLTGGAYGMDVMTVGRAFCADLWQAIEVGALSTKMPDEGPRKIVIFPSMQWFMCYRRPKAEFPAAFSEGAFDAFMGNDRISGALKERVLARMADYGVDRRSAATPLADAVETLDRAAAGAMGDVRLGLDLALEGAGEAPEASSATPDAPDSPASTPADAGTRDGAQTTAVSAAASPDWQAIFAAANARAREAAAGNDLGLNSDWYTKSCASWLAGAQRSWKVAGDAYFSEQEFEDFETLLQVCQEAGVEPLVVIQPVKGALYDQTIYNRGVRARYYDMIRGACAQAGVAVADFSSHEYDPYFLRDYSHPSDLGGAYYSQAIYTFYQAGEPVTSYPR